MSTGATTAVPCPLCGPQGFRAWTHVGQWRVVKCAGCGLLVTWPRPSLEELREIQGRREYYAERGMDAPGVAWVVRAREILEAAPGDTGRVLDLGAGEGHLVAAFRELGLRADGVEPSRAGREAARERYGIELGAELAAAGPPLYSLVTLVHSLEHVPQPLETLRSLRGIVCPSGGLFVEVPHVGSVEMWRPARRRHILDLPVHLHHFTPETLARLARAAGFEVARVRLFNSDAVEWLLARRARWREGAAPASLPSVFALGGGAATLPAERQRWREALLFALRRGFPGWKFQVILRLGA